MYTTLGGYDRSDDATLDFDVIAYRGSPVATYNGWAADVKSRGGNVTVVPGGFWHDMPAGRWGSSVPYAYELQPVWMLPFSGVDLASREFLDWVDYQGVATEADNQMQAIRDVITTAGKTAGNIATGLPDALKWAAIGIAAVAGLELVRAIAPRRRA